VHELAICQGILSQVGTIANEQGASRVDHIIVSVGPLSGIEPPLLDRAFEVARCGTVAGEATLEIRNSALVITCRQCGNENETEANRLLCSACGSWQVNVKQGDEMLLLRVELSGIEDHL
jgi:hydrogenase nickel incorporation protein HypA/HybF